MSTQVVSSSSSATDKANASWIVRAGLGNNSCLSFESRNTPGSYIRHYSNNVYIASNGGSNTFDSANLWADDVSWVAGTPSTP